MSSVFLNGMERNLEEDAALTEQRPRQSFQEDRSPDEDMMMETEQVEQDGDMDFMLDGLLEVIRRLI